MKPSPARILAIDDNQGVLDVIESSLKRENTYQVYQAISAEAAYAQVQKAKDEGYKFALVILDLRLPRVDGIEIYKHLRRDPFMADVPVLILSAMSSVDIQVKLLEMGADDYITKPFSVDELLKRVQVHLQLSQLRQAKRAAEVRAEKQQKQLETIRDIGRWTTKSRDLDSLLEDIRKLVAEHFSYDYFLVYLSDRHSEKLKLAAFDGEKPAFTEVIENSFFAETLRIQQQQTKEVEFIPVCHNERCLGLIVILQHPADEGETGADQAIEILANQLAIVINDIYLFSDLQERNEELGNLVQELRLSQKQLVQSEKLAATGRLAASLAHEINNPLQAVQSCLQLAITFDLESEKRIEYLEMANEEIERLGGIVKRILDFSRPSSGVVQKIKVNTLVRQVVRLADKYISHSHCAVQQALASDIPQIRLVPDQIAQVFLHLLLNALDAMPATGTLTIRTRQVGEEVRISFEDTGVGMSPEIQSRVFEPFYSTKEDKPGLGLPISHGIVKRHGGHIWIESEVEKGTTVHISLPVARSGEPGERLI